MGHKFHSMQIMASIIGIVGRVEVADMIQSEIAIQLYVNWAILLIIFSILFLTIIKKFIHILNATELDQGLVLQIKHFINYGQVTSVVLELSSMSYIYL